MMDKQEEFDWTTVLERKPKLRDRLESLSRLSYSSDSSFSEESLKSFASLVSSEEEDGFESGFDTFNDFLHYSTSSLPLDDTSSNTTTPSRSSRKLRKRLRKLLRAKALKRWFKRSSVQKFATACAILFRGVLFVSVNIILVLVVIISLSI